MPDVPKHRSPKGHNSSKIWQNHHVTWKSNVVCVEMLSHLNCSLSLVWKYRFFSSSGMAYLWSLRSNRLQEYGLNKDRDALRILDMHRFVIFIINSFWISFAVLQFSWLNRTLYMKLWCKKIGSSSAKLIISLHT